MRLEVKKIVCGYSNKIVVNDVSFSLEDGQLCALVGLNGCGKTTLLKSVCSLLKMKSGSVFIDNGQGPVNISNLNEKECSKLISFIPQRFSMIEGLSVFDVVLMGYNPYLKLFETPSFEQKDKALMIMKKIGIDKLKDEDFSHLSEGYKQLVVLARTLVQNTSVMLMDEPDSALDYVNKNFVLSKIKTVIHEEKKCGLISIHDPLFAIRYCDRLLLMKDGKIVKDLIVQNETKSSIEDAFSIIYGDTKLYTWGTSI